MATYYKSSLLSSDCEVRYVDENGITQIADNKGGFYTFSNVFNFNYPVKIGSNITGAQYMFSNCYNFNQQVNIPDSVKNTAYMFANAYSFDQDNLYMPANIANAYYMLFNCFNFTGNIIFPENMIIDDQPGGLNVYYVSPNTRYNQSVLRNIQYPKNIKVTNGYYVTITNLYDAMKFTNYNEIPFIPNVEHDGGGANLTYLVANQRQFNQPVTIPNNYTNISYMFHNCHNFNSSVTLPNNMCANYINGPTATNIGTQYMFANCYNFNKPIQFPSKLAALNGTVHLSYTFDNCINLNSSIVLPTDIYADKHNDMSFIKNGAGISIDSVFNNCWIFNKPVTMPNIHLNNGYLNYGTCMFAHCYNFNAPVTIPNFGELKLNNGYLNLWSYGFFNCRNFNQPLNLPANVYLNHGGTYDTYFVCTAPLSHTNYNIAFTFPNITINIFNTPYPGQNSIGGSAYITQEAALNNLPYYNQPIKFGNIIVNVTQSMVRNYNNGQLNYTGSSYYSGTRLLQNLNNFDKPIQLPDTIQAVNYVTMVYMINGSQWNQFKNSITGLNNVRALNGYINFYQAYQFLYDATELRTNYQGTITLPQHVLANGIASPNTYWNTTNRREEPGYGIGYVNFQALLPMSMWNYNGQVNFTKNIYSTNYVRMNSLFYDYRNFNRPIALPKIKAANTVMLNGMFYNCQKYQSPVTFNTIEFFDPVPANTTNVLNWQLNLAQMFYSCIMYNQPMNMRTVTNAQAVNMIQMFYNCAAFNSRVDLPAGANNLQMMFYNCKMFSNDVYCWSNNIDNVCNMFRDCNTAKRKNIYTYNFALFNKTTAAESVVGAAITWSTTTNCQYNAAYNIYIYNNMPTA